MPDIKEEEELCRFQSTLTEQISKFGESTANVKNVPETQTKINQF